MAVPFAAFVYFLVSPALPALQQGDQAVLVAGAIGLLLVAAVTLSLLPAHEALIGPLLIVAGAGLLMGALNIRCDGCNRPDSVGAAANVAEALVASSAGLLLARWLRAPAVTITVPLFVALIDAWSVASGPTSRMLAAGTPDDDPLSFNFPGWGDAASGGHLGFSDALFLMMFACWGLHYGFRRVATIAGLVLGLVAALVLSVVLDTAIPALPLLAAGFLLPNVDRLKPLLRAP